MTRYSYLSFLLKLFCIVVVVLACGSFLCYKVMVVLCLLSAIVIFAQSSSVIIWQVQVQIGACRASINIRWPKVRERKDTLSTLYLCAPIWTPTPCMRCRTSRAVLENSAVNENIVNPRFTVFKNNSVAVRFPSTEQRFSILLLWGNILLTLLRWGNIATFTAFCF